MKKLIYPDSNSSLFNAVDGTMVSIIRDTNFYGNIKKASSSAISRQLLEDCKPDKDHFLIHITALGDDETYGFNKNADGFPKKANEKYYKTFETNANLFREHNSSSPKNRIGIIKAAAYNPDMHRVEVVAWGNIKKAAAEYEAALAGKPLSSSMGCFPAGTKITLSNATYKNIEDIALGDSVVTKSLDKSLVTKLYRYDYSGVLYSFKIAGKKEALNLTPEHPVFIRRYNEVIHKDDAMETKIAYSDGYLPANEVKLGDYVISKFSYATEDEKNKYDVESYIDDGFIYKRIDAITIESVEDIKVYNLEIAEDPSYIADSIVVHNCSVVHDRDNISGKLSKNPSEYEPWMKRFPCKFIEEWDGKPIKKWAYVHNDEPTFFDLSIVAKPADRIADYLEYRFNKDSDKPAVKIASENPEHIPSAYLPELLGYDLTKFGSEINRMKGDLNNFFNNKKKVSVLNKLASMEKEYIDINSNTYKSQDPRVNYIKTARYTNFDKSFKLSESDIQQLKELRPETLFFELKKRASVLPFNAFVDLIYNGYPKFASEEQKDKIVKYAEIAIVPTVFSEVKDVIENDGCLPCGDSADGLFDAGDPLEVAYDLNNTDPVQKIMDGIEEKLSLKDDKKQQRIIQITIIQGVPSDSEEKDNCGKFFKIKEASVKPEMELTSSEKNIAKQLAFSYAFYKIAAISDIFADNIPEISLIDTISQNFLAV